MRYVGQTLGRTYDDMYSSSSFFSMPEWLEQKACWERSKLPFKAEHPQSSNMVFGEVGKIMFRFLFQNMVLERRFRISHS